MSLKQNGLRRGLIPCQAAWCEHVDTCRILYVAALVGRQLSFPDPHLARTRVRLSDSVQYVICLPSGIVS